MGAIGENFPNKTFLNTTGKSRKKCCVKKDMYLLMYMMSTAMKVKSIIIMHQLFPLLINKFTARIHFNTRENGCDYRGRCSKVVDLSTSRIFKFHTTICLLTNRSSMLNFGEFHSNHRDQSRQPNCKQHKKFSILNFFLKELTH